MSELFLLPPPPPPGNTFVFGDPALAFPEFAAKHYVLEKVIEEENEGEDSSYGKGSFDLSSRFSSPSFSRNECDHTNEVPKKSPSFGFKGSSLKLSGFREEEEDEEEDERKYSECFRQWCACTCMCLSIVLIIVLLTGLSLNISVRSKLPQVYVTNLKFSRLDFAKSSTDFLMTANLNTVLQLSNKNDKTLLYYTPLKADVSSENINLGQKKLLGFKQNPGNVTFLKIATRVRKSKVNDVDATLLKSKEKKLEAMFNVFLRGKLGFDWFGFKIHLPIVVACENVKQSDVKNGLKPECDVQIFSR